MICKISTTFERFTYSDSPDFDDIMNIASRARIPRISKIIDMWDVVLTDDEYISLTGMMRYVEFLRDYPIPERHFYVRYDGNGRIHLTAFFDTHKLIKLFDDEEIITEIIWGDYSEQLSMKNKDLRHGY